VAVLAVFIGRGIKGGAGGKPMLQSGGKIQLKTEINYLRAENVK
jgi:hypothetical protein